MKKSKKYLLTRAIWYLAGFVLLFAPFALLQKALTAGLNLTGRADIHGACLRMSLQGIFNGKGLQLLTTAGLILAIILGSAFFLGPVFCGRFCVTGALPEYLSRIIPDRLKIDWQKHINPAPVRYGMLTGFLATQFFGLSVVCSFCSFSFMQKLTLGIVSWNLGVLGSTTIVNAGLWLVVLGLFAKGGRGYCSYLCPIGATQSLLHAIGSRLGFTYKLKFAPEKCAGCNLCVKDCPMGAIQASENGPIYNLHACITCRQCEHTCPKTAISYGRGNGGWINIEDEKTRIPNLPEDRVNI